MKKTRIALLLGMVCAFLTASAAERFPEKAFYLAQNLAQEQYFPALEKIAERAEKAGYNTVYLADWKFASPWTLGPNYVKQVQRVVKMLRSHKLRVIVYTTPICDPCAFLTAYPEEVETMPSRKTPFKVVNGVFTPQNMIPNGSFERGLNHWRADAKANIKLDSTTGADGKNSLHFKRTCKEDAPGNMMRVWLDDFKVQPFTQYTITMKLKTKDLKGPAGSFGISFAPLGKDSSQPDGFRYLSYRKITNNNPMKATQDWKEYKLTFNTLETDKLQLVIGSWGLKEGEFWIDDVKMAPASFMNVVRTADLPCTVTSADGKTVYQEGKDYTPIRDPRCGNARWKGDFGDFHAAPQIKVLPGSRIKEGDTVLASYYHAAFARTSVCICLNSPKLKPLITRQVEWFNKHIQPEGYVIGIDEHRCYGYCPRCEKSGTTAGVKLEEIACYAHDEIKRIDPKAAIYMWNDMFDPAANCYNDRFYYMIKGKATLYGNWHKLPKDIIILRWTTDKDQKRYLDSMKHWHDLGFKYVQFPGYFDLAEFNPVTRSCLKHTVKDPACIGVAFAQWSGIKNFRPHFDNFLKVVAEVEKEK